MILIALIYEMHLGIFIIPWNIIDSGYLFYCMYKL